MANIEKDMEKVERFLGKLPSRAEELNYCEDEICVDNDNFTVLASVDEDGEMYVHLEISLRSKYKEGDEPIGNGWNWMIYDLDDLQECIDDIRRFLTIKDEILETK